MASSSAVLPSGRRRASEHGLQMKRDFAVVHGSLDWLIPEAREYVLDRARLCQPDKIHVCDGSEAENAALIDKMVATGTLKKITSDKFENW